MEAWLSEWMSEATLPILLLVVAAMIYTLGKGADLLVQEAVTLSHKWHVPKALIGATVVSLGTTLPEMAVSVLAALKGNPDLAMGNAVGSIICDTGLILGLAAILSPLPLVRSVVNRQGWIQPAVAVLLVVLAFPFAAPASAWTDGGHLARGWGFALLGLLAAYLAVSVIWARRDGRESSDGDVTLDERGTGFVLLKLICGIALVVLSSKVLIPAVEALALRLGIPQTVIAATLVAFGTSLPELVTCLTAVRRGHGEIAVGNVIGADILNVLFVLGAAVSATPGGLAVPALFFQLYFPTMLFILVIFRVGVAFSGDRLKRPFGFILLATYLFITVISYR